MDEWISATMANGVGVVGVIFLVGMMVVRGYLIPRAWHHEALRVLQGQVSRAEERADRWEAVALRALDATERLTEPLEVTAKVLTKLPNPSQRGEPS